MVPELVPDGSTTTVYVPEAGVDGSGTESMKGSRFETDTAVLGAPFEPSSMPTPPVMLEPENLTNIRWSARPVNVTRPFWPGVVSDSVVEPPEALGVTDEVTSVGTIEAVSDSEPENVGSGVIWIE